MFAVPKGQLILGQATILVQSEGEEKPRVTVCDMIASGSTASRILRQLAARFIRKLGFLAGLAALALFLQRQSSSFDTARHLPMVMGAISSAVSTSFKSELGIGTHNFTTGQDAVKCALFTSSATLGASTTAYSATNEISGTGYTAAGVAIANVTPTTSGTTAIYDWADAAWTTATFTANGALVYNSSKSNKSIFSIAFGSDQSVTAGTFTIVWPVADASNAIIRLA